MFSCEDIRRIRSDKKLVKLEILQISFIHLFNNLITCKYICTNSVSSSKNNFQKNVLHGPRNSYCRGLV